MASSICLSPVTSVRLRRAGAQWQPKLQLEGYPRVLRSARSAARVGSRYRNNGEGTFTDVSLVGVRKRKGVCDDRGRRRFQ